MDLKQILSVRSKVNLWVAKKFSATRKYISHSEPVQIKNDQFSVTLLLKNSKGTTKLGNLCIKHGEISLVEGNLHDINNLVAESLGVSTKPDVHLPNPLVTSNCRFYWGDGIAEVGKMDNRSVDLLLTDPPYKISKSYRCENEVPNRLRKNGKDFPMPKGHFGKWDTDFPSPAEWTKVVLPKVRGWAVIFCAHAQIGEYCQIMKNHRFIAISPMVWHKTNPVPFNHKTKPLNAWEAIVAGKRPSTTFNGHAVHSVFTHKSPIPQDRIHATQKPEGLLQEFVRLFSNSGEVVVDPFAGSGSTLVAATREGRVAIGYESDLAMFGKAKRRYINKVDDLP